MREEIKEKFEHIKKGEPIPETNPRKKRFSRIFLLMNLIVFLILLLLIFQKKEHSDYIYQTVLINNIQVRFSIIHSINKPILATITLTSPDRSVLPIKKPFATITILHQNTEITSLPVHIDATVLHITPDKPITHTVSIPLDAIIAFGKKHDLLQYKRYAYHSVIPLTVMFTLHTIMDYSTSLQCKCKVTAK
ncbi:MAG TPA: hypothetical protein P5130_13765 [Spirochaetota bacterium]|nr:hypothetical protein [Spirochaetota bacterium]